MYTRERDLSSSSNDYLLQKKPIDVLDNLVPETRMAVTISGVCPRNLWDVLLLKIMQMIKADDVIRNAIKHLWMFETIESIFMHYKA